MVFCSRRSVEPILTIISLNVTRFYDYVAPIAKEKKQDANTEHSSVKIINPPEKYTLDARDRAYNLRRRQPLNYAT